jgi:hypothetical protein
MKPCRVIATLRAAGLPALLLALVGTLLLGPLHGQQAHSAAFDSAEKKFAWLGANGRSANPSRQPTVLTADEWNAYLNEGGVKMPEGVSKIRITSEPGIAHGGAEIDFDRLTANRTRSNPFLALFTGKHQVTGTAHLSADNGIVSLQVDSVEFDGVEVPRLALEFFASRYLRPKYGNAVGMDSTFALHNRTDTAMVGVNQVTITQR